MLWSSVPQLRWHVTKQVLATWFCLVAMAALFWYQPAIVRFVNGMLLGSGFVASEYDQRILASYFSYGWWSLLVAWGTSRWEASGCSGATRPSPTNIPSSRRACSGWPTRPASGSRR
jgi:hypothetical protein